MHYMLTTKQLEMQKQKLPSWITDHCIDCGRKLPIKILHSDAGYYIGQWCEQDGPYSRISQEYFKSMDLAQEAWDKDTFTMRQHP